ncbi:Translation initiation factor 6 [Candidatus Norongarragalina meridionalis]|nr:Translation initiation factor 6 [Candidatus Norongarragalina meridionalis]
MKIEKTSIQRNPFLGIYLRASEKLALAPKTLPQRVDEQLHSVLGVEHVVRLFINESPILGVLCAINSKGCAIPHSSDDEERAILKKAGLNVCVVAGPISPGNAILANDRAALVSPLFSKADARKIGDHFGVEVFQQSLAGIATVGASSVVTNAGILAYNETSETELKFLEKIFGVTGGIGSCNGGVPFNSIGIVANSRGALVGESTTGYEVQRIYEALSG